SLPKLIRRHRRDIKKLRRLAHDPRVDWWSLDECHFQQHGTRAVMWVPPENTDPVLLHAPTRKSVALFGAVNLRHGQLVTLQQPTFGALTFRQFCGIVRAAVAWSSSSTMRAITMLDRCALFLPRNGPGCVSTSCPPTAPT